MTDPTQISTVDTVASSPSKDLFVSQVRTATPQVFGLVAAWLLNRFHVIDTDGALTLAFGFVLAQVYYFVVRILERVRSSKWGWLLGAAKAPVYPSGSVTVIPPATVVIEPTSPPKEV